MYYQTLLAKLQGIKIYFLQFQLKGMTNLMDQILIQSV